MRDIAPGFDEAIDRDAFLQMLAVVPALKSASCSGSISIEVSNMPFPASGIARFP
jgi:hypothetical protein